MAIQKTELSIPFVQGIDTKTNEKLSPKPKRIVNAEVGTGNTPVKRPGLTSEAQDIQGGGTITNGNSLTSYNSELLMTDKDKLYSRFDNNSTWVEKGDLSQVEVAKKPIFFNVTGVDDPSIGTDGNVEIYAYRGLAGVGILSGLNASVYDISTGLMSLMAEPIHATGLHGKVVSFGGIIGIFYIEITSGDLEFQEYIAATNSFGAATTVSSAIRSYFAVTVVGNNVFISGRGTTSATIENLLVDSTLTVLDTATVAATTAANTIENFYDATSDTYFTTFWSSGKSMYFYKLDSSFNYLATITNIHTSVVAAIDRISISMAKSGTDELKIFYSIGDSTAAIAKYAEMHVNTVTISSYAISASSSFKQGFDLSSEIFEINGAQHFLGTFYSVSSQSTSFLFTFNDDLTTSSLASKIQPNVALGHSDYFTSEAIISGSDVVFVQQEINRIVSDDKEFTLTKGVQRIKLSFDTSNIQQSVTFGDLHNFSGGFMGTYDGEAGAELGFMLFPDVTALSLTAGAGLAAGTYSYKAVYEWTDARGQKHRSAPSLTDTITLGGASNVIAQTNGLVATKKSSSRSNVRVHFYRTVDGGDIFYKVTPQEGVSNSTSTVVSYTDSTTDVALVDNELLYTTGGVLENASPAPSVGLVSHANRIFYIDAEDRNRIGYSKTRFPREPALFNDFLDMRADSSPVSASGEVKALGSMDERLIIFKDNSILAVSGDGPNDLGTQNTFSRPQLISTDVGVKDPKSVVLTPLGLMFKSDKGIYILTRALSVKYIGEAVEEFNDETISSAILIKKKNQVKFTTISGQALVYNYFFDQWQTADNHEAVDAALVVNDYYILTSAGVAKKSDATVFTDDAASVAQTIETGWIQLKGVQGYQRIYRAFLLGDYKSDHEITLSVRYNYQDYYTETHTLVPQSGSAYNITSKPSDTDLEEGINDGVYQFDVHLEKQRCQAIKFIITEVPKTPYGESFSLTDLTLQVGVKKGPHRLTDKKKF